MHAAPPESAGHATAATVHIPPSVAPPAHGASHASSPSAPQQQQASGYRLPPKEILDIVDAEPQPGLSYSPDRTRFLQLFRPPALPPIHEMARPELKLAGLRVDPEMFARSKMGHYTGIAVVGADQVVPAPADKCMHITGYPAGAWLNYAAWSPDSTRISFTTRSPGAAGDPPREPLALWVADAATGVARPLLKNLHTVFDDYSWLDDHHIVACVVPAGVTAASAPQRPPQPPGPRIQDNSTGRKSQNRTYPDLLKDEHDVALFEHYGLSEIVVVDVRDGSVRRIAPKRMYSEVDVSPDGRYLLVSWLERPYSFNVPCGRFPKRVQLWRADGSLVREMAALPLAEDIPIAFNSTRKGPRGIDWRTDKPCELYWVEAQDGGDPAVEVSPRDIVYTLCADAASAAAAAAGGGDGNGGAGVAPRVLATTDLRCGGVAWGDDDLAILYESWWKTRRSVWWLISPGKEGANPGRELLYDRNYEDVYTDPGSPLSRRTEWGTYVLAKVDGKRQLLMEGTGATPEGNRPFLDLLDLGSRATTRLWQSSSPFYEQPGSIMNDLDHTKPVALEGLQLLLTRESAKDPPQSYIVTLTDGGKSLTERQVTNYPHPYPTLRDMQREVLRYPRNDGVMLTATLYTPPGYDAARDGPLPCVFWAYPREFKSKDAAGQMRRSPHQFTSIGSTSPTLWVARGYAVLDGPTLPIVAEGQEEPNDTFLEQLTAGAQACVDECVRRGIVDPKRVSVGGHSYGAFMAANLVTHAPGTFACGIARTGAFNRTLTPFGFQNEERTLWQAADVYARMSPFMSADKVTRPLLLIHGEDDNNPGTFPLQSERYYHALKGHGATCRLVLLPHESHGYRARESIMHTLYEMDQWVEKYAGFGRTDPDYHVDSGDEGGSA